ncbi:MAG: cytochrome C oxidase Cbb3 [Gammaproteobacteria bacterium]|nr:cytochrome C oxidase Cbb3 [Gammaproteobacteria bacterium]
MAEDGKADATRLYTQYCAECHGAGRLGAIGPALLPENLKRLRRKEAHSVIQNSRPAVQMPPFKGVLNQAQTQALVDLIYSPLEQVPVWRMEEIKASQIIYHPPGELPDSPLFDADVDNLFMVVELGDHHATLLNGDNFNPIHRFPTRFALHGGPKWAEKGRYIYFASRDGWISKFDVFNLKYTAEIRAGINTRNLAVSHDGRYVIAANYLPHTLVVLDASDLSPLKVIPAVGSNGVSSRVSAVYTADPRESFVAALKDIPEVWEINYSDEPPVGFSGWVHDYREDSGDAHKEEPFPVRQIEVKNYLDDFFFTQKYDQLIGTSRELTENGESQKASRIVGGQVVDLDLKRAVARVNLPGMPHLSSAITWNHQGKTVLATPNIRKAEVTVVDMETWEVIKRIPTEGPGFFMRSHEKSPYAWVDVFFGPNRDLMHVIDKQSLEIVKTLRPAPGKTSAHVEFTKNGSHALVSIWDMDGAVVIYDAHTLQEIKRLPMKKPSGKYNVHNKLTRSSGTSH